MKRVASVIFFVMIVCCCRDLSAQYIRPIDPVFLGVQVGGNYSWLTNSDQFYVTYYYPYSDDGVAIIGSIPFANPSAFSPLNIAVTADMWFASGHWGISGRAFYRSNTVTQTSESPYPGTGQNTGFVGATYQDHGQLEVNYIGLSLGALYEFWHRSLYMYAGFEFSGLTSDRFQGYEQIVNPKSGQVFLSQALQRPTGATMISVLPQPTNGANAPVAFGFDLAVGSNFDVGERSEYAIVPELLLSVPFSTLISTRFSDLYALGYPTQNLRNPSYAAITTPYLWYIELSVGFKFQVGGFTPNKPQPPKQMPADK